MPHQQTSRTSSMVAQLHFGTLIHRQRGDRPAAGVAKALGISRPFYSMIENGHSLPADTKLPSLAEVLGFDDDEAEELAQLLATAKTPGWWQPYASILDPTVIRYLGLETGAVAIHSYENRVFHGLLQNEAYARSVISNAPDFQALHASRVLQARIERQEHVFDSSETPLPQMTFAFSETVLMQHYDKDNTVLRPQLEHVLSLVDRLGGALELRVQPFTNPPRGLGNAATVVILSFGPATLSPVAYQDTGSLNTLLDSQPATVDRLQVHYDLALESCLSHTETIDVITNRLRQLTPT